MEFFNFMKLASSLDRFVTLQYSKGATAAPKAKKSRKFESAERFDVGHLKRNLATDYQGEPGNYMNTSI